MQSIRERRRCKPLHPYLFLLFELTLYVELGFFIYAVFGLSTMLLVMLAPPFTYLIYKSLKRFFYVKGRCKSIASLKKYRQILHAKAQKRTQGFKATNKL